MTVFAWWGRLVYRWRYATLVLSALLLLGSMFAIFHGGNLRASGTNMEESGDASRLLGRELPHPPAERTGWAFTVIFSSPSLTATDPAFKDAVLAALSSVRGDTQVVRVQTPYDAPAGGQGAGQSRDGKRVLAYVFVKGTLKQAEREYPRLRALVRSDELQVLATGGLAVQADFDRLIDGDLRRAEFLSLPLALILLLIVFGTVVGALLPVGVGLLALAGGIAGAFLLSRVTDVSPYALNIVALIGLGVAIDYSLFILNRFREELAAGATVEQGLAVTLATAGRAIAFSGLTVAVGLSAMLFYGGVFASLGLAGTIVVAVAVFYAVTFLPAMLAVLGPRVNRWGLPVGRPGPRRRIWHSIATAVMRRPGLVLVPTVAFILVAASPFLRMRLANAEATALPPNLESRIGEELIRRDFPGADETFIQVVARFPGGQPLSPEHVGTLYDLSRRIAQISGVTRVQGPVDLDPALGRADYQRLYAGPREALPAQAGDVLRTSVGEHVAVLTAVTTRPPQGDDARNVVKAIRAHPEIDGGRVLVTGRTAIDLDEVNFTLRRTPPAVAFVTLVTYVVLFLLLGSVVLPLKAVVMNLLSISASFGAMVWIFQQGHLSAQLNFTPASIDPVLPVILFGIVFGLSMDYEVFLLSRIQEEYHRVGDNRRAVAQGLERSGRLITGAAAIMVAVFSAFALGDIILVKSVGLAMAIAVALDATIVRALIVPATMRLLGWLNWWAPAPVARLHRRLAWGEVLPVTGSSVD